ncbi:hypothetical protein RUND412_000580 [Rhizina undulata]
MSRAAKTTFVLTALTCVSVVSFVHYTQRAEQAAMHAGVIRDEERQRIKRERQEDFDLQQALEREYLKSQNVTNVPPSSSSFSSSSSEHRNSGSSSR